MSHATGTQYLKPGVLPHMWCAGCGIGTMLGAMLRAFEELGYSNTDTVVVTGIGCTGKLDDYLVTNALHTTHGRALAYATGIKAFNPRLHVVVIMGDGDGVTIGGNHFIHAARRNMDLTAIVLNNLNYGMTGGQASGTTPEWSITSTTAYGNPEREFDICALAEAAGANYVARVHQLPRLGDEGDHQGGADQEGLLAGRGHEPLPDAFRPPQRDEGNHRHAPVAARSRGAGGALPRACPRRNAAIAFRSAPSWTATSPASTSAMRWSGSAPKGKPRRRNR